jgi:methylated-DNA-[protein]-cysteine S-methyltransferase
VVLDLDVRERARQTRFRWVESPLGRLLIAGDDDGLRSITFDREGRRCVPEPEWIDDDGRLDDPASQLEAYFAGRLVCFDLDLAPVGTEFQIAVWRAVEAVPYGETATYGQIAASIGKPKAVRAVGAANGANPLPIVIPCHRVIGSDGRLTGYGGGLDLKAALLELERSVTSPRLF